MMENAAMKNAGAAADSSQPISLKSLYHAAQLGLKCLMFNAQWLVGSWECATAPGGMTSK
jgi:hypothetical protein